jgi:hypothetical protein
MGVVRGQYLSVTSRLKPQAVRIPDQTDATSC